MKILQVIHTFPPYSSAGSEIYTLNLSRELSGSHDVRVFHRFADPGKEEYLLERDTVEDLPVYRINHTFKDCDIFETTYRNRKIESVFADLLDEFKPDVVHFHHLTCLSTGLIETAKTKGIPVIFTLHDYWLLCQRSQFLDTGLEICSGPDTRKCLRCLKMQVTLKGSLSDRWIKKLPGPAVRISSPLFDLMRKVESRNRIRARRKHVKKQMKMVDHYIAPSDFLRRKFLKAGVSRKKIEHLDYGFDLSIFENVEPSESSGKITFGYIGTLIPPKGVHVLIKAFSALSMKNAELLVYGSFSSYHGYEDYPTYLTDLAQGDNAIKFMGRYENRDVASILSRMDVVVVPSIWWENSPLTIHEAFLAGKPVIASRAGGITELIRDGVNGFLFETGSHVSLKSRLEHVLRNPEILSGLTVPEVKSIERNTAEMERIFTRLKEDR